MRSVQVYLGSRGLGVEIKGRLGATGMSVVESDPESDGER